MEIERVDLGVCRGYLYAGDADRTALVLPGAMLGGMPSNAFVIGPLVAAGWRVVQVWDEREDDSDREEWARARAEAAFAFAGKARLISGKSVGSLAAGVAAERGLAGVWLTPLLGDAAFVEGVRRRTAPALLVGGTADWAWDGALARSLADDVLEIEGADHGLARLEDVRAVAEAVTAFSGRLRA